MHEILQSEVFLGKLLGPLTLAGLPLMIYVLKPLAKSVLVPLVLTAASWELFLRNSLDLVWQH